MVTEKYRTRKIIWTTKTTSSASLKNEGYHVIEYQQLKTKVLKARNTNASRSSLNNPADPILILFRKHAKIAVNGVPCHLLEDIQIIYGYIVEPAFRLGCTLFINADNSLSEIHTLGKEKEFQDSQWRYPWTIDRLIYITDQGKNPQKVSTPNCDNKWRQLIRKMFPLINNKVQSPPETRLDQEQTSAVRSGEGVVQIIAPAGSGKTTVLIERVKELQKRGTPADRILCMSFNRDAMVEIGVRLIKAGVKGTVVRSFHGMGLAILKKEHKLRREIGGIDDGMLKNLIGQVSVSNSPQINDHNQISPISLADVRKDISNFKLALMVSPQEALHDAATGKFSDQMSARIYSLYENELARRNIFDFDDLVSKAVRLLQTDSDVRQRWQNRFDRVLVDEYQDIEPSQSLLVGILAAPQDSLFCVGDEDQCIYAWRRATVQRIIELDQVYPGIERHALIRNYRCGHNITKASRNLVQHNKIRFRKPLEAGSKIKGDIVAVSCDSRNQGADLVAHLISDARKEEVVVLARTSRLLEEIKTSCQKRYEQEPPVELATIHAAKGREWDRVILYAIDEEQMPHAQAVAEGALEDERRLFYVAITRAKLRLEIICTKGQESRFLQEAGISSVGSHCCIKLPQTYHQSWAQQPRTQIRL